MRERHLYEVALVRAGPEAAAAETTVVRLVGLLPPHWTCAQRLDADGITLVVSAAAGGAGPDDGNAVRKWLARVLGEDSLRGWRAAGP
ncbi:hypothetical protein ACFZBM_14055 [Streptomyces lavendulae]|uniref:Uncharacterized protein n=1 Tax=Streptomyces lavendulae subsp. lavendulae TaxID=58340 RepID=A0A2K8PGH8_STRLA|nr:hypothetical protein [Streptomyces lavendulae]ATZ25834.1 hypothetical protein SLAV_20050 [Streptomyces lavendulae subsp. lavendulae]QUQ55663.1 hypothetical protein SLLC_18155 [Streptomyces lavendulae subsp. lavendulae]